MAIEERQIKSRSGNAVYTVQLTEAGWRCNCRAGIIGRRCWHVEAAQVGGDSPDGVPDVPMGGARRSVTLQLPESLHNEIAAAAAVEHKTFSDFVRDALADAAGVRLAGVKKPAGRFQQIHMACIACGADKGEPCRSYADGAARSGYHSERRSSWQAWRSVFDTRSG